MWSVSVFVSGQSFSQRFVHDQPFTQAHIAAIREVYELVLIVDVSGGFERSIVNDTDHSLLVVSDQLIGSAFADALCAMIADQVFGFVAAAAGLNVVSHGSVGVVLVCTCVFAHDACVHMRVCG
jgi:hypothetical protein